MSLARRRVFCSCSVDQTVERLVVRLVVSTLEVLEEWATAGLKLRTTFSNKLVVLQALLFLSCRLVGRSTGRTVCRLRPSFRSFDRRDRCRAPYRSLPHWRCLKMGHSCLKTAHHFLCQLQSSSLVLVFVSIGWTVDRSYRLSSSSVLSTPPPLQITHH